MESASKELEDDKAVPPYLDAESVTAAPASASFEEVRDRAIAVTAAPASAGFEEARDQAMAVTAAPATVGFEEARGQAIATKRAKAQVVETRTYHDGALVMVHVRGPNPPSPSKAWWFQWSRSSVLSPWRLTWDGRETTWSAWHLGKVVGPSQKRFCKHYIQKHKLAARVRRQGGSS